MEIKKLKEIPYGNAFVEIVDNETYYLWSYQTLVAKGEKNWLSVNGLYSMTTRRHIGAFVREYCNLSFQTAKKLYSDGMMMDITTGEVTEIK